MIHTTAKHRPSRIAVVASLATLVVVLGARFGSSWFADARGSGTILSSADGPYLIGLQPSESTDRVVAVAQAGVGAGIEVANLPHVPGYNARGSVSPDGRFLAVLLATSGTPSHPIAELLLIDLRNGSVRTLVGGLPELQTPVWANDSRSIVLTRQPREDTVEVVRVSLDGDERLLFRAEPVLGVYPVGFGPDGAFYAVMLDGRGSTLLRDGAEVQKLSSGITRDWSLSPDGRQLGFIELLPGPPLTYVGRVVSTVPGAAVAQSSALLDSRQRLGVAWNPATGLPLFGVEPGPPTGGASAQSVPGIDRPILFAPDGSALVVEHWDGATFEAPGRPQMQIIREGVRTSIPVTKVFGWSAP